MSIFFSRLCLIITAVILAMLMTHIVAAHVLPDGVPCDDLPREIFLGVTYIFLVFNFTMLEVTHRKNAKTNRVIAEIRRMHEIIIPLLAGEDQKHILDEVQRFRKKSNE